MIGTIVNTCAIIVGSTAGSLLKKGINEKYSDALFSAIGLAATGIGINSFVKYMPQSEYPVLFIVCLALGTLLGTALNINDRFQALTSRGGNGDNRLAEGLSTGILLYCIGTLSILGPIQSALNSDHTLLFTNAALDLITSMILASSYGIGMIFAAPVLFIWQGGIYLLALQLGDFMSSGMMAELSVIGGFLIMSSGLGILKIRSFKTLDMLPALLGPVIWYTLVGLIR